MTTKHPPSDLQVADALRASGYLFEQEVATLLETLGFHVETNSAFLDLELEKSRELDVRAIKVIHDDKENHLQVIVELLVECKDAEAPFVFVTRSKNVREIHNPKPTEYLFPRREYTRHLTAKTFQEVPAFLHFDLPTHHYYYREAEKATQFAKIVRKGSEWQATHEGVYDSLILPMAKALEARRLAVKDMVKGSIHRSVWLFFPIVVLSGSLLSVKAGEKPVAVTHRKRVSFVRELQSEVLSGHYLTDFVTFESLQSFVELELLQFAGQVAELARNEPKQVRGDEA